MRPIFLRYLAAILLLTLTGGAPAAEQHAPPPPPRPEAAAPTLEIEESLAQHRAELRTATESIAAVDGKLTIMLYGMLGIGALQVGLLIVQIMVLSRSIGTVEGDISTRNRPRLLLRHADLEIYEPGRLAKVHWIVENMGNSATTIIEAHATLVTVRRGGLPAIPQYDERNHAVGGVPVEVGRNARFVQFSREDVSAGDYDAVFRLGNGVVLFYGYLLHEDALKVRRRVGFCRLYDTPSGRFTVLDDPNYEYAD